MSRGFPSSRWKTRGWGWGLFSFPTPLLSSPGCPPRFPHCFTFTFNLFSVNFTSRFSSPSSLCRFLSLSSPLPPFRKSLFHLFVCVCSPRMIEIPFGLFRLTCIFKKCVVGVFYSWNLEFAVVGVCFRVHLFILQHPSCMSSILYSVINEIYYCCCCCYL